jgi:uncharacterized protein YcfJ
MLEHYLVKRALLGASRTLAHQGEQAERRRRMAERKASQLALVNELIANTHKSRVGGAARGALSGGVAMGLPLLAPSLYYRNPAWALGGAAVGALGGGYLGSKVPQWSEETLRDYAKGDKNPVFWDSENHIAEQPLSSTQRVLVRRALGAHRG